MFSKGCLGGQYLYPASGPYWRSHVRASFLCHAVKKDYVLLADPGQELGEGAGSFLLQQSPLWMTRILRVCSTCRCLAVITYGLCFSYGKEGTRDLTCDSTYSGTQCLCVYQDCSRVTPAITCACHMSNWDLKTWVGQVLWEVRVGTRGCRKQRRAGKRWPGIVLPCAAVTRAPH